MLLPIGDDNTGRRSTPLVVYSLVAINIVMFLIQLSQGEAFTYAYAAVPYEITKGVDLVGPEPVGRFAILHTPGPEPIYLTLLSSMFMHGGFMHIAGNMLFLWIFGDNVEDNFGRVRFIIFYLICGLIASFAQIAIDPGSKIPTLGASGAIAGVLGAYVVLFPHNTVRTLVGLGFFWTTAELPAVIVIGIWIVLQFFGQVASIATTAQTGGGGVAYMAHIGGAVAGLVLVFIFRRPVRPRYAYRDYD
jgi:membrane associated rhomboid family serine protease